MSTLARSRLRPAAVISLAILSCLAACATRYDHSIAVATCDGIRIEVLERYRRQGFSGFTGDTRYVLIVKAGGFWRKRKEIDITPIDTIDLSGLERSLPAGDRWRGLAPHEKASRRVFVSPKEFSVTEYDAIASCLARHASEISTRFATARPPVEYFDGEGFSERWAGLSSIAYREGNWQGNPCQRVHTTGFRLPCAGLDGFLSIDGYGYVGVCVAADPVMPCGRAVGKIAPDGAHAFVRPPSRTPRCAQGALDKWLGEDPMRLTRDCRLPSGESLADLFSLLESENLP